MSSADDLFKTSTIAGKGILDETIPDIVKRVVLNPNTITVRAGTPVSYTVEKEGYLSAEGSLIAKDFVHDINVKLKKYVTLTVAVTPVDSNVTLTAPNGISVSDRIIKVPEGTYVSYVVSRAGFNTKKGNVKVDTDTTLPIIMSDNSYTFTVNPTPIDAGVELIAQRPLSPQIGNSIVVEGKPNDGSSPTSTITYIVSKEGYETYSQTIPYISSDTTVDVTIKKFFSVNISVSQPEDAVVKIKNIVGVSLWEPQKYYDLHAIVKYDNKFYNATSAHTSTMEFEPYRWVEIQSSGWVIDGDKVEYEIKRVGYKDIKSSVVVRKDENIVIKMESTGSFCIENVECIPPEYQHKIISDNPTENLLCLENNEEMSFQSEASTDANLQKYTFTVNPIPVDSLVELSWNGTLYYQRELENIPDGDFISYTVSKDNYVTKRDQFLIASDMTKEVPLELQKRTLTIMPTPEDATVTLLCPGYTKTGNSMSVHHGNTINWEVNRKYWVGKSGSEYMDRDKVIDVTLTEREVYTVTVNITPADTTLTLSADGYPSVTSDNGTASMTVDSETVINWTASRIGYNDKSGSITAVKTETIEYSMTPGAHTYTIIPIPSDATVTLRADGYSSAGNSITVYGEVPVSYEVTRNGLVEKSGTRTITSDVTETIALSYPSGTVIFESSSPGPSSLYVEAPGRFNIVLVGGGGSGAATTNWSEYGHVANGGQGALIQGITNISAGTYSINIGEAGPAHGNGSWGGNGGDTTFNGNTAGGGKGGRTAGYIGEKGPGYGGTATVVSSGLTGTDGANGNTSGIYGSYGAGGGVKWPYSAQQGTGGYVKIIAV